MSKPAHAALSGQVIVVIPYALTDNLGFPTFPLGIDIPARRYLDRPGTADLPALLRWIADTAERDGMETVTFGGDRV